jgi:DNA-binding transcriptional MerR regulator
MAGVTIRTLHHYDEIGLLVPSERSAAGYRVYSAKDVDRLAQVMAYRACGLGLPDIAALLDATDRVRNETLRRHIDALSDHIADLEQQRDILNRAWEAWNVGINLNPQEIFEVFGDHDPTEYAQEARERWGDTDAYAESHRRTSSYTKDDWVRIGQQSAAIEAELVACLDAAEPADSERATSAAEAHRQHIERWFYPCTYEMQAGLGDMYVADPRFAERYESLRPGLAAYLRDAILANAIGRMS